MDGDYAVPAPLQATPPAPRDDVLTNEHLVRLVSAGISEDLVIVKIHAARTAFRVGTDDLIELKQAGVSDRVMLVMIDVTHDVIRLPTPAIK